MSVCPVGPDSSSFCQFVRLFVGICVLSVSLFFGLVTQLVEELFCKCKNGANLTMAKNSCHFGIFCAGVNSSKIWAILQL